MWTEDGNRSGLGAVSPTISTESNMNRNLTRMGFVTLLLFVMSGCVHESTEGSARVFTYRSFQKFCDSYRANTSAIQHRKNIPFSKSVSVDIAVSLRLVRSVNSALVLA
jgi:hypothetical protein